MNYQGNVALPNAVEDQLDILPGPEPDMAIRICLCPGQKSHVRLEQLAYSCSVGWYVQKSFQVPAEMLPLLAQQLRKAHCLMPQGPSRPLASHPPLRLGPAAPPPELSRRGA